MAAQDQEFRVANVIRVSAGVEINNFPQFPRGGLLIVLEPACLVLEHELNGYAAEITPEPGTPRLVNYEYWHMNDHHVIGLLAQRAEVADVPLRSRVRFVKRR